MKIRILFLLFLLSANALFGAKTLIVLFDTSKSMVGLGDGRGVNILGEVQATINTDIIDRLGYDDILLVYPFDAGVDKASAFKIQLRNENDRKLAKLFIKNLRAEGKTTHLSESILYILNNFEDIKADFPKTELIELLIFTDGRGNAPDDKGENALSAFLERYQITKGEYPYLYTKFFLLDENIMDASLIDKLKAANIDVSAYSREDVQNGQVSFAGQPQQEEKPLPESQIYRIELLNIDYNLKNYGKIDLLIKNMPTDSVAVEIVLSDTSGSIPYRIKKPASILKDPLIHLSIEPQNEEMFKKFRKQIKKNKVITLFVELKSKDPRYEFVPKQVPVEVTITKKQHFLLPALGLGVFALGAFLLL